MASKNLGAVVQRAISDDTFRRQLQSDPAAALRGFNLTPTEIAAIRSGDPAKLMSLGVDQRVSKAFTFGTLSGTRAATSDLGTGATSNGLVDPTIAGTRAVIHDSPPFGTTGTSAVEDPNSPEYAATQHAADLSGTRVVNDVAPFGTPGTSAIEDPNSPEFSVANRMAELVSMADATRAVHDVEPFDSGIANTVTGADGLAGGDVQHDPSTIGGTTGDATGPDTSSDHSWG